MTHEEATKIMDTVDKYIAEAECKHGKALRIRGMKVACSFVASYAGLKLIVDGLDVIVTTEPHAAPDPYNEFVCGLLISERNNMAFDFFSDGTCYWWASSYELDISEEIEMEEHDMPLLLELDD